MLERTHVARLSLAAAISAALALMLSSALRAAPPDSWRKRLLAYEPYDGTGRYTMSTDDGVRGIHGLRVLASRFGAKPYDELKRQDKTWQSERVIFRDVDTGAAIYRLTNDPWADQLSYFKGNWSADGKYIVWRRRPGMWESSTATHGPMAMRSDGTQLRDVFRDYRMVRKEVCSPTIPDVCYALAGDRKVIAFDLKTGKTQKVLRDVLGCWHAKISLDGKYLMGRADIEKGGRGVWILSTDGKEYHEIPIPESIHDSYQFHPSRPHTIMYWYEGRYRTEGFVQCDFEGKNLTKVPVLFDWNHGDVGPDRGAHTGGYVTRIKGNTWLAKEVLFKKPGVEYYDNPHQYNGYLTWRPKDRLWVYSTRIVARPHISEIHAFFAEPAPDHVVNRCRICYTALKRPGCLDNPGASPDGTKVLFNSNVFDRVDAYYVVAKLPEPPTWSGRPTPTPQGFRLSWAPPKHHAEIAGYHVYRSTESGRNFECITDKPVTGTEFVDPKGTGNHLYALTSVEHSGLESILSAELAPNDTLPMRVYLEAETGQRSVEMWNAFHATASNLHYVWMRKKDAQGRLTLRNVVLPKKSDRCILWGRVKGKAGARFSVTVGAHTVNWGSGPSEDWQWVRSDGTVTLDRGPNRDMVLASSTYGSAIDCLVITDDPAFNPATSTRIRRPKLNPPRGLRAEAASPYSVRLSWEAVDAPAFHHYNLYCSKQPHAIPDQSTLVASPDQAAFLDYALNPGETLWYRVSLVDRAGGESDPSPPVAVTLAKVDRVNIEKAPADTIEFEVPHKDTYVVWLRLKQNGRRQYVGVTVDENKRTWTCSFDKLSTQSWFSYGRWGRFNLEPGKHTLKINNNTDHVIEKVFITNDLSQRPTGHVNTLGGW